MVDRSLCLHIILFERPKRSSESGTREESPLNPTQEGELVILTKRTRSNAPVKYQDI